MNRLKYFKITGVDDYEGDFVREADTIVSLAIPGGEPFQLPVVDWAGALKISLERVANLHVLCMHAFYAEGNPCTPSDLLEQLTVPNRCFEDFGEHAVIVLDAREFVRRVSEAAKGQGYRIAHGPVFYYRGMQSKMDTDLEAAFQKRDVYRYQREYRIAVNTGTEGCDPLVLSVGDLSDITRYMKAREINHGMKLMAR